MSISAADRNPGARSDHTIQLVESKFEANIEIIEIDIPEGYSIGGQAMEFGTKLGELTTTLATDNPLDPGREVTIRADLTADVEPNKWKLVVDLATNSAGVPVGPGAIRTTTIDVLPPTRDRPGKLTFTGDPGDDRKVNEASAVLELVIFGTAEDGSAIITNPSVSGVYRWLARAHTTADVEDFLELAPGDQTVIIKDGPTPTPTSTPVAAATSTPTPVVGTATPSPTGTPTAPDVDPPTLLGLSVSPSTVQSGLLPVDVTFAAEITDDVSGIDEWTVVFTSPSGTESILAAASPGLTQGSLVNGIFEATTTLPPLSELGPWAVTLLTITDLAGRSTVLIPPVPGAITGVESFVVTPPVGPTPTPVVATATPSPTSTPAPDLEPPTLVGVSVSPPIVESGPLLVDLTFTAEITDDVSGVDEWTVVFSSPSGTESILATASPGLTVGTLLDGIFEATAELPPFSQLGPWEATSVSITDLAGRTTIFTPPVPGAIPGAESFVVTPP